MQDNIYCGQCGGKNPSSNRFCGRCGSKLDYTATVPIDYENREFKWRVPSNQELDCVLAREQGWPTSDSAWALRQLTETEARTHFWQKYQKEILDDFQKWQDAGWNPFTEVGASCIELEKLSSKESSLLLGFMKSMFMEKWCFVGATIKVRRPKSP